MFPRILCAVLSIAVIILVLKIYTVQRALKEISTQSLPLGPTALSLFTLPPRLDGSPP